MEESKNLFQENKKRNIQIDNAETLKESPKYLKQREQQEKGWYSINNY